MYILTAPMMCCADINIISISSCFILEWLNFGKKMMNHQDWSCTRSRRICGRRILPVLTTMLRTCATTSPSACASVAAAVTTTSTKATSAPSFSSTATASSILHFLKLLIYPILIPSFFFASIEDVVKWKLLIRLKLSENGGHWCSSGQPSWNELIDINDNRGNQVQIDWRHWNCLSLDSYSIYQSTRFRLD